MKFAEKKVFYNYFEKFLLEINGLANWLIINGLTSAAG
jgi:hypothetical protein